jgi:predicted house-cleaning noncanonical NTP pyrophosphatase (MazG superfamily)
MINLLSQLRDLQSKFSTLTWQLENASQGVEPDAYREVFTEADKLSKALYKFTKAANRQYQFQPKLVRDNVPGIYNVTPTTVTGEAFIEAALAKLVEESLELQDHPCIEEFADVSEVVDKLQRLLGYDADDVKGARLDKKHTSGAFEEGYVV